MPADYVVDEQLLAIRRKTVSLIATQMELTGSAWPGEGARADVERIQVARRIAAVRWMTVTGRIGTGDDHA